MNCEERKKHHQIQKEIFQRELAKRRQQLVEHTPTGVEATDKQMKAAFEAQVNQVASQLAAEESHIARFVAFTALFSADKAVLFDLNVDDVLYFNVGNADVETPVTGGSVGNLAALARVDFPR